MPLFFDVKVIPSSGRQRWIRDKSGQVKCYLKNPPEKGKANQELIALLAKSLGCSKQEVRIVTGLTSRKKRIEVAGDITYKQLLARLGLLVDMQIKLC